MKTSPPQEHLIIPVLKCPSASNSGKHRLSIPSWVSLISIVFTVLLDPQFLFAVTYPPTDGNTFLYGNSGVDAIGQTSYVNPVNNGFGYRYFVPKNYDSSKKYPVIIYLHGLGERGTDNTRQLDYNGFGSLALLSSDAPDNQTNFPCFFVAPQHNSASSNFTWPTGGGPAAITNILATLSKYYSIDTDRIYLTGVSMGGMGAFDLPCVMPRTFACTVPLSGQLANAMAFPTDLPIWIFHAADDSGVPCGGSDGASSTLRYRGMKVLYTRYAGGDHTLATWNAAWQTPSLLPWMFAQKRGTKAAQMPGTFPGVLITSAQKGTTLNLAVTAPPDSISVGWTSSAIDYNHTAKTDGVVSGSTFSSASASFTAASVGSVIGISINSGRRLYPVTAFIDAHTVTIDNSLYAITGSGLNYLLYTPGNIFAPSAGTLSGSNWALSSIPLTKGYQMFQALATLPSYRSDLGGVTTVNDIYTVTTVPPSGGDTTAPTITLTSPGTGSTYATSGVFNLAGNASDNVGVTAVSWSTNWGYSGTATGTTSWLISNLPLQPGDNLISVVARDAKNNTATATINVTYSGTPANLPPAVSAGTYQVIQWPTKTVILAGTVSDDGLPAGSTVNTAWSTLSGPGLVTFSNPNSLNSTATFPKPGTYVLQLTASDSLLSSSSRVCVSVLPSGTAVAAVDSGNTSSYTASDGTVYSAESQTIGSNLSVTTLRSPATADDSLYKNYRSGSGSTAGTLNAYTFAIPNGIYDVDLKFIEPAVPSVPGSRLLNILAQSSTVTTSLDVYDQVGCIYAYDHVLPNIAVTNGTLSIQVTPAYGATVVISALVVRPSSILPYSTPTLSIPSPITVNATDKNGASVTFNVNATDTVDGPLPAICIPASGTIFPIGTSTVNCSATNSGLLSGSGSFTVTVKRSYHWFQSQYGLGNADPGTNVKNSGLSNLVTYAFGMNPFFPDRTQLPTLNSSLQISYPRWKDAGDLVYTVEVSNDLQKWFSGPTYTQQVSLTPIDATREQVVESALDSSNHFFRLKISQP